MALVPSRQSYNPTSTIMLDSFHTSICKHHFTRCLQFFRYGSSTTHLFTKHKFLASYDDESSRNSSQTPSQRNPPSKSNFLMRNKNNKLGFPVQFPRPSSSSGWLDKWDDTHNRNRPEKPKEVLDYRDRMEIEYSDDEGYGGSSVNVNDGRFSDSNGGSTMEKIVERLKKYGYVDDGNSEEKERVGSRVIEKGSIEDIFYVEEGMLPNARGGFSPESPLGVEDVFRNSKGEVRFPWEKPSPEEQERRNSMKQKSKTSLAELTLPESELRRLRNLAFRTKNKTRIGAGGVTQEMVGVIRDKWKSAEVVRLKIEGAAALNMKRIHEILERRTGGLVIWRSGTSIALYRGVGYEDHSQQQNKRMYNKKEISYKSSPTASENTDMDPTNDVPSSSVPQTDPPSTVEEGDTTEPLPEIKYEDEVDKLLDGLGTRYADWPGCDPLPVDGDLLPGIVHGYQPPFRLLPYGVRSTLGGKEATALRRLARVLPPHFALGRSRQHQGLAMAMIKLWERSSIAKIALKRGVQLTTSERMAEEIKKLTGGLLLSRNKDFLVFYRGKDFLSPNVAEALLEKERLAKSLQDEEEQARLRSSALVIPSIERTDHLRSAGTLGETLDANARWGKKLDNHDKEKVLRDAEAMRHADLVRKLERKLAFANRKLMKAEHALSKVEAFLNPADRPADPGSITDEERFMFRKLGLRMKAFLLLGRRGVFDGIVENMHLHWKYRELVKIIVNTKNFEEVKNIALSLESESGGVLVSVDKVSKGYAVVVFRGKDYKRPPLLRPKNLLTKRKALARSIELQRREALLKHISVLQARVEKLRSEIKLDLSISKLQEHVSVVRDQGNQELYDRLDSAYPTEDDDSEEEEENVYLESYDSENDVEDESDGSTHNLRSETDISYDFQDHGSELEPYDHLVAVSDAKGSEPNERRGRD